MTVTPLHEYRFIDKTTWGPGPWQTEPDKIQWQDMATGLACLAVRHPVHGHWCGYVGVPEGHPLFGKSYDDAERFDVHGGITFADTCQEDEQEQGICHIPQPDSFACIHEMRRYEQRDRQGVHGGDYRRRGLDQSDDPHHQTNQNRETSDRSETCDSSINDFSQRNRLASLDMGSGNSDANLSSETPPPSTGLWLEDSRQSRSVCPDGDSSVSPSKTSPGPVGSQGSSPGRSVSQTGGHSDGGTISSTRRDDPVERNNISRYCVECGHHVSPERTYWLGFDAAHAWDRRPGMEAFYRPLGIPAFTNLHANDEYRTLEYIQEECTRLARQLYDVR